MNQNLLKIGIPGRFFYPSPDRSPILGPKVYTSVEQDTLDYVSRAGALPMMIPLMVDALLEVFMDGLDGLLLQGGADVAPQSYGELPMHEDRWLGDPQRDAFELKLLGMAMDRGMPIFGICRGLQIMNVFFGGTLIQDIPSQIPSAIHHRDIDKYDGYFHGVEFVAGGLFEALHTQKKGGEVNSIHHQGIKQLGKGLQVEARCSEDGLIEGFVHEEGPKGSIMAVQWHPEFFHHFPSETISANLLLEHWLEICRAKNTLLEF